MEEIKNVSAVQIIEQKDTNSVPFLVLCDDDELYYAKTMFKKDPPFQDIINEILSVYILELMGVSVIPSATISISQDVFDSYLSEGKKCDNRYKRLNFHDKIFFGSKYQHAVTELEIYGTKLSDKYDFNKYSNPIDFLKIGVFDFWIGNKDRRTFNPNILLNETENGKIQFLPIDHTQAFANQYNYKALNPALMNSPHPKTILKTQMSKSIVKFAGADVLVNLQSEILSDFDNVIDNLDFVFDQVPKMLGLSQAGRTRIRQILSDGNRNKIVAQVYLTC